jgi:hypothetical protein
MKFNPVLSLLPITFAVLLFNCSDREQSPPAELYRTFVAGVNFSLKNGKDVPSRLFTLEGTDLPERKPLFSINGKPFIPVIIHQGDSNLPDQETAGKYIQDGFNVILVELMYEHIGDKAVISFIEMCRNNSIPLIIELHPGSFWRWLDEHEENNMWFSPDYPYHYYTGKKNQKIMTRQTHIKSFPDYSNPETKAEYHRQLKETVRCLSPYFKDPIIALSIGAYDHFHIPEGERHPEWDCEAEWPKGVQFQTWLPYGPYVEKDYRKWLKEHKDEFDFEITDSTSPPLCLDQAANFEHWRSWIIFRRYNVRKWIKDTYKVVKENSGLPVGMTFDLNWSLDEKFASPSMDAVDILDFLMIYQYILEEKDGVPFWFVTNQFEIQVRTKTIAGLLRKYNKPATSFLVTDETPADMFIEQTAPYFSGMQLKWSRLRLGDKYTDNEDDVYSRFIEGLLKVKKNNKMLASVPLPGSAIYMNPEEIFLWGEGYQIGKYLFLQNENYDVVYDIDEAGQYSKIYIPYTDAVLGKDAELQKKVEELRQAGKIIILKDCTQLFNTGLEAKRIKVF